MKIIALILEACHQVLQQGIMAWRRKSYLVLVMTAWVFFCSYTYIHPEQNQFLSSRVVRNWNEVSNNLINVKLRRNPLRKPCDKYELYFHQFRAEIVLALWNDYRHISLITSNYMHITKFLSMRIWVIFGEKRPEKLGAVAETQFEVAETQFEVEEVTVLFFKIDLEKASKGLTLKRFCLLITIEKSQLEGLTLLSPSHSCIYVKITPLTWQWY